MILILRKARSCRCQIWAVGGWVTWVIWCFAKIFARDVMHEQLCCPDEAANYQLPVGVAFWIIQRVSVVVCSSWTQNFMQTHCCSHSVILNAMATQYTCSLKGIYCPHWLIQWSCHCPHMHIPVHSPWLPGYIHVVQTVLVIINSGWTFSGKASYIQKQTNWYHGRWRNKAGFKQQFLKIKVNMSIQYVCGIL